MTVREEVSKERKFRKKGQLLHTRKVVQRTAEIRKKKKDLGEEKESSAFLGNEPTLPVTKGIRRKKNWEESEKWWGGIR